MKSTALAAVQPIHPLRRPPVPVPRAGVATVSMLATPLTRGALAPPAEAQPVLDLIVDGVVHEPRERPHLHLVAADENDLEGFATRFAQTLVEVTGGDRSVHQLLRWTTGEVYDDLLHRSYALQRTSANAPRARRPRAQVLSVHLSRPHEEAAELSIHVRHGARSSAIAARIDLTEGRWQCTALQFG